VTFNHGVLGSIPSALTKIKQALREKFSPSCFPEKSCWEAAGKKRRFAKLRRAISLPFYALAWIFGIIAVIMMALGVVISGEDIPL
jgi:hypothetical protein